MTTRDRRPWLRCRDWRSQRDRMGTALFRPLSGLAALALLLRDHELQPRPGLVDGADLDVDEAERQCEVADDDVAEIGSDAGGFLRPGHPDHPIGRDQLAIARELGGKSLRFSREQMHHFERRGATCGEARALGPLADDLAIICRCAVHKNAKARLEAELLREWFAGSAGHGAKAF